MHTNLETTIQQLAIRGLALFSAFFCSTVMPDVLVRGSIEVGVGFLDSGWQLVNDESHIGFSASSTLGQESSVFMNYAFEVDAARGTIETGDANRLSFVGVKAPWGSASIGTQWGAIYNTVGTFIDQAEFFDSASYQGQERIKESFLFTRRMGLLLLQSDLQLSSGGTDLDRFSIGALYQIGRVSIGLGWQDNGASDFSGIGASLHLGNAIVSGGYNQLDDTAASFGINAKVSNFWINYDDPGEAGATSVVTGNYEFDLGEQMKLIVEVSDDQNSTQGIGLLKLGF